MRSLSLTARQALYAEETDEVGVVLVTITHPDLPEVIRLSSDPTERLTTEPLTYGTRSQGQTYQFVLMSALVPSDPQDGHGKASLVFENVDADMAAVIRSILTPATVDMFVVLASAPDDIEAEYLGLYGVKGSYTDETVTLDISREPMTSKGFPSGRMTRARCPGLFR